MLSRKRRQLTFGGLAGDRSRRTWLAAYPLKFNFLGYRRDGVADLADSGLQYVGRDPEPPCPGTNLGRIRQIYFVSNGRMFDAMHGGVPWLRTNGIHRPSFHFSRGGLFLEKYIERARHIEVQIFGDGAGHVIALGERDCSSQRRNQKLVEETPAPGLSDALRQRLVESAIRLGKAVNYQSAGTVEFVFDAVTEEFYFLEVNTRLQVEHGVTEEVTGVDLVEWMIRQAANDDFELRTPPARGASIQVRLYAEDPAQQFMPSTGLLTHARFGANARVESLRQQQLAHWCGRVR